MFNYLYVGVLIVVYNDFKSFNNLMLSLEKQIFKNFRIYVLNNSNLEFLEDMILEKYQEKICYFKSENNIGFGAANNLLAQKAIEHGCKYLFVLNPDMELSDNTIYELVCICENDFQIGMCNGIIMFGNEKKEYEIIQLFGCKANYKTQSKKFLFSGQLLKDTKLPQILTVDYLNAGSLFIRSSIVKQIGLFDDSFFMYNEEIDIAKRVKELNYKLIVTSRTKILHHHDWRKNNIRSHNMMYYYMARNRYLYFYKYHLYFFMFIDIIWQVLTFPIKIKMFWKLGSVKISKYYYLGIIKGLCKEKGKSLINFET